MQVDEEDLSVLASLLYMPMTSKTQLQRVFSNAIINHSTTRSQALRILLAFLRSTSPSTPCFGEAWPCSLWHAGSAGNECDVDAPNAEYMTCDFITSATPGADLIKSAPGLR